MGSASRYLGELAGCWWSFPSEAGSRNHDLYRCYWGITYCIGEPWRSTSVGRWVPWLPTCWVLKFEENVTSFCSNFVIKFWIFRSAGNFGGPKGCQIHADRSSDLRNSISTEFTSSLSSPKGIQKQSDWWGYAVHDDVILSWETGKRCGIISWENYNPCI